MTQARPIPPTKRTSPQAKRMGCGVSFSSVVTKTQAQVFSQQSKMTTSNKVVQLPVGGVVGRKLRERRRLRTTPRNRPASNPSPDTDDRDNIKGQSPHPRPLCTEWQTQYHLEVVLKRNMTTLSQSRLQNQNTAQHTPHQKPAFQAYMSKVPR